MPARPPRKPIAQQLAESSAMLEARDAAQQTPAPVRRAFLGTVPGDCGLLLAEFSLGILWLFEELKHPFNDGAKFLLDAEGQKIPVLGADGRPARDPAGQPLYRTEAMSMRDTARAILIWHDPEAAHEALAESTASLDGAAMQLAVTIRPDRLQPIIAEISKRFTEGLATIPGAGGGNPAPAGS